MQRLLRRFFTISLLGLSASLVFLGSSRGQEPDAPTDDSKDVSLQVVDYQQLVNVVKKHRGKVILVDVWSSG